MAGSFVATTDRIRGETPASIRIFNRSVSPDLEALVNKAMAKDAGQRYASAQDLLEALRQVHGGLTTSGLAQVVPQQVEGSPKKTDLAVGGRLGRRRIAGRCFLLAGQVRPENRSVWASSPRRYSWRFCPFRRWRTTPAAGPSVTA